MERVTVRALLTCAVLGVVASACGRDVKVAEFDTVPQRWREPGHTYRLSLTLLAADLDERLQDFPVLLRLDSQNFDYGLAAADGADLRAVSEPSGERTPLSVERWDPGGESIVWIRHPGIDPGSEERSLWIYFGSDEPAPTFDSGVFSNGFSAVVHLAELGDAGEFGNDATASGTSVVEAQVGDGRAFTWMDNESLVLGSTGFESGTKPRTLCAWVQHNESAGYHVAASVGTSDRDSFFIGQHGTQLLCGRDYPSDYTLVNGVSPRDTWLYTCCSYADGMVYAWVNGALVHEREKDWSVGSVTPRIGAMPDGSYSWDGKLDEVRFSNVARSGEWIRTEYRSMTDDLLRVGSVESR